MYERVLDMLANELQRSRRQRHQLACCFFDIDHFKAINDEHGHMQGNKVLASTGDALLRSARGWDCVGRFGGDEFVVVMPETSLTGAHQAATRMCDSVKDAVEGSTGLTVTTSAGVAEWQRGETMLELLESSDRALQAAKAMGGKDVFRGSPPRRRFATFSARSAELGRNRARSPGRMTRHGKGER